MSRKLLEELFANSVIDVSAGTQLESPKISVVTPPENSSATTPHVVTVQPTILQKAKTATRAAVRFVTGGMTTVTADLQQRRLKTCQGCEHYNGSLCGVCGCLISAKSWLPTENCPLQKWPEK